MFLLIMNILDFFTRTYARLHNYPGVPYWTLTPLRKIVRYGANKKLPKYLAKPCRASGNNVSGIIVSFTSFPERINEVWQVVKTIKKQSLLPEKIILWLSKEQFPTKDSIPESLLQEVDSLFEIRMVDGDIRSHKKYYYVAKEFPNNYVFLIDDDIYYPTDLIERTWNAHLKYPDAVICNYGYEMTYMTDGSLSPYLMWSPLYKYTIKKEIFFGSGGGTLFKPSSLYKDLTNIELAMSLAPIADDIWLNAMVNISNIQKVLLPGGFILPIIIINNKRLATENRGANKNDEQIKNVVTYYTNELSKNPFEF